MKLYKTYEDLYLHTTDDQLAKCVDACSWVWKPEEDDYSIIYGIFLAVLLDLFDGVEQEKIEEVTNLWPTDKWLLQEFISCAKRIPLETKMCINNIMHILHTPEPALRDSGYEWLSSIRWTLGLKDISRTIALDYEGIVLDGKDSVPEEWCAIIRNEVKDLEVALKIKMSWMYSHCDNGLDYAYDIPELLEVHIYGDSEELINKAEEKLRKLPPFVWKGGHKQ